MLRLLDPVLPSVTERPRRSAEMPITRNHSAEHNEISGAASRGYTRVPPRSDRAEIYLFRA